MKLYLISAVVIGLSTSLANAQQISKTEPRSMRTGEKVLVDNGRCGKGRVQEVTGGRSQAANRGGNRAAFAAGTNVQAGAQRRQRRCVARP